MSENIKVRKVRNIPTNFIEINPNNPRIIFDQEKIDRLIGSIKNRDGILVPLNVYLNEKKKFTIIDGERRYKAALQLGIKKLPVIINDKPQKEEYAIDMFHIHNLLEPWELVPTALKLKEVSNLFKEREGRDPIERELNEITGLTISEIRRCRLILTFPDKIQDMMLEEEAKTSKEKSIIGKEKLLTGDFFIEMAKNLIKPLKDYNYKVFIELGGNKKIFDSVVKKRRKGLIKNIVGLRPIPKYLREHPIKAGKEIKHFIKNHNQTSDNLLEKVGLVFDFFKFERNLNVFLGALENIPKGLESNHKEKIAKLLRKIRKQIDKELQTLKD